MSLGTNRYQALDLLSLAVLVVNTDGEIMFANTACEHLIGQSIKQIEETPITMYFEKSEYWLRSYQENPSAMFSVSSELADLICGPNVHVQVFVSIHPSSENDKELIFEMQPARGTLFLNHNRHMAELSENNRRLLRNLAHEIKNPLGGIRGAAQLLDLELMEPEHKEYTEVIISEADRLQGLVDRILLPYRCPYKPEKTNIHEILEKVRLLMQSEFPFGPKFVRDYDISVPEILGDRGQLTQIFLNLIRNAVEAFPAEEQGKGRIRLSTRVDRDVMIGTKRHKTVLSVHVIDNGPGISKSIIDSIFFPLVTDKAGGSGLGLSLVHAFVEQHGGSIEVNSRKGNTDFSLMFPLEL